MRCRSGLGASGACELSASSVLAACERVRVSCLLEVLGLHVGRMLIWRFVRIVHQRLCWVGVAFGQCTSACERCPCCGQAACLVCLW